MKYVTLAPQTLLEALAKLSPESSKTTLRSWLKDGRVAVDGHIAKIATTLIKEGQEITLGSRSRFIKGGVQLHYEDSHLVVVEKPSGLLSVATAFEKGETVHAILKEHYHPRKVFVVHRLDQDTSGIMLFALSEQSRDQLKVIFEEHNIERAYSAIVEGHVEPQQGTWQSYVYEDDHYVVHSTTDTEKGRLAITHYVVAVTSKRYTALLLKLETGRKNQIRVHCQDAGFPIVGDKKYGASSSPIKRLCLHAHLLAFLHPITQQKMRFESEVPEAFYRLVPLARP